jgi:alcohol dehydrogenase (NADP+)
MTTAIRGYAAHDAENPLAPFSFERRDLRPNDVQLDILFCGVCHSDLHQVHNAWGNTVYPLVPGHEIVGRVSAVGSEAGKYKVGDKVAVGCMVDSCQQCEPCQDGEQQYCLTRCTQTYGDKDRVDGSPTRGGYSTSIVVREEFVLRLPEELDPAAAAPLLCAGITTYSPLNFHKVSSGTRLGVIGLGGLGHMAIKFGAAMGAEVTLFTTSPSKIEEAKRLGAHKVVLSSDQQQMGSVLGYFDLIIDTVPVVHSMNEYLMCLRRNGNMVLVGPVGVMDPPIHTAMLMGGRKALSGSAIGGIAETQQMLDYCAEKGITCDIEMINIQDINEAYERMDKNDVHYRFVIDMASME